MRSSWNSYSNRRVRTKQTQHHCVLSLSLKLGLASCTPRVWPSFSACAAPSPRARGVPLHPPQMCAVARTWCCSDLPGMSGWPRP